MARSSSKTVAEANSKYSQERLWAGAVIVPLACFSLISGFVYFLYRVDTVRMTSDPRRLPMVVSALSVVAYAGLAKLVRGHVNLCLPLAPAASRDTVCLAAGAAGFALSVVSCVIYNDHGQSSVFVAHHASTFVALACAHAVSLSGILAAWLWIRCAYRGPDDHLPR